MSARPAKRTWMGATSSMYCRLAVPVPVSSFTLLLSTTSRSTPKPPGSSSSATITRGTSCTRLSILLQMAHAYRRFGGYRSYSSPAYLSEGQAELVKFLSGISAERNWQRVAENLNYYEPARQNP